MYIIFLGPPGAGKGTQAKLCAGKLGTVHLSTGEILRKAVDEGTPLGLKAKSIIESGKLVSDDIMIAIIKETLSKNNVIDKGFILDGFPRTLQQAVALEEIFKELKINNIQVVNIIADEDELVKRLLNRGRKDDTAETVKHRLQVFKETTVPVVDFYSKKHKIFDVYGVGDIEEISCGILSILNKKYV